MEITSGAYAKIERGETEPNISRLYDLGKVLTVTIYDFFEDRPSNMDKAGAMKFVTQPVFDKLNKTIEVLQKDLEAAKSQIIVLNDYFALNKLKKK